MTKTPKRNTVPLAAAVRALSVIAGIIYEAKQIPSGHLYARLMHKTDLLTYQAMIDHLQKLGLVEETAAHLLRWTGPQDLSSPINNNNQPEQEQNNE